MIWHDCPQHETNAHARRRSHETDAITRSCIAGLCIQLHADGVGTAWCAFLNRPVRPEIYTHPRSGAIKVEITEGGCQRVALDASIFLNHGTWHASSSHCHIGECQSRCTLKHDGIRVCFPPAAIAVYSFNNVTSPLRDRWKHAPTRRMRLTGFRKRESPLRRITGPREKPKRTSGIRVTVLYSRLSGHCIKIEQR